MIIDSTYIINNTLLSGLSSETPETIDKYINRAESIVGGYIDFRQFNGNYPDDLKLAILFFVEYLYSQNGVITNSNEFKSEKIGDYSYERFDTSNQVKDVDMPTNIKTILNKYRYKTGSIGFSLGTI